MYQGTPVLCCSSFAFLDMVAESSIISQDGRVLFDPGRSSTPLPSGHWRFVSPSKMLSFKVSFRFLRTLLIAHRGAKLRFVYLHTLYQDISARLRSISGTLSNYDTQRNDPDTAYHPRDQWLDLPSRSRYAR